MQAFQRHRGLFDHGQCDEPTWLALVESSWKLGDRPLRLVAPFLRGDDVGALQSGLARLGFDCGRVDGIFGPATARALEDFQRNCGLEVDGVCGPATLRALLVNGARTGSGPGVAAIRELERLSAVAATLQQLRVVVGQFGGLGMLARHVARSLRQQGAKVITADELDPSLHAGAANRYAATVYVGFEARTDERATIGFYATAGFESAGGRALAERLANAFERHRHAAARTDERDAPPGAPRDADDRRGVLPGPGAAHRRCRPGRRRCGGHRARPAGSLRPSQRPSWYPSQPADEPRQQASRPILVRVLHSFG